MYQIIFSDADGTLLDSNHCVLPRTREALQMLKIPFVIVSGRYPCGIYSIMRKNGLKGPIISCGGALILDEERRLLYQHGMTKAQTAMVTAEIDDATWNIFSLEDWLVRDPSHPRIRHEEKLLDAVSRAGSAADLAEDQQAHKGADRDVEGHDPNGVLLRALRIAAAELFAYDDARADRHAVVYRGGEAEH